MGYGKGMVGFQFGTGDKKDNLFAAGLIVIVVAAIGLTVYQYVFRSGSKDFVFECTACHHEFSVSYKDPEVLASAMGPYGVAKPCPKCGQQALCTIPCTKCGKDILKPSDSICPDCGANTAEVLAEKVRKAKEAAKNR